MFTEAPSRSPSVSEGDAASPRPETAAAEGEAAAAADTGASPELSPRLGFGCKSTSA